MTDALMDALIDTLKLLPYLLITFLILEFFEHKLSKKNEKILSKNKKYGPILGGILGAFPQCGFSTMASNLYSSGIITTGTLIAVFLSTSDEMLPILLGEKINPLTIAKIVGFKVVVGITLGFVIDLIYRRSKKKEHHHKDIHDLCEKEHCDCEHDGIILSSIKHALKIGLLNDPDLSKAIRIFIIIEFFLQIFLLILNIITPFLINKYIHKYLLVIVEKVFLYMC